MIPKNLFFSGIGGAGMAPLAELLWARGFRISGSDEVSGANTKRLAALGIGIHIGHDARNLPSSTEMLVFSSAVPPGNCERREAAARGIAEMRRGELLAEFSRFYRRSVAVSGSHGKSSISAMTAHILRENRFFPGVMIGAKLYGAPDADNGQGDDLFICEADESDGTHALLETELGIVPNVDGDHAWSVGGEEKLFGNFRTFAHNARHLIAGNSPLCRKLFSDHRDVRFLAEAPENFAGMQGFQATDAFFAVEAAKFFGVSERDAVGALQNFGGVARRMHLVSDENGVAVVEDYAHHPAEVAASICLLRKKFPDRHLEIVFQPHRYARLERYFDDFVSVLSAADSVIVADVFSAWSETGKRGGKELSEAIGGARFGGNDFAWIARLAKENPARPLVIAVLGAGSIDQVLGYL